MRSNYAGSILYPENVIFAFNRNVFVIRGSGTGSEAVVTAGDHTFTVPLYGTDETAENEIDISSLLHAAFTDIRIGEGSGTRCRQIPMYCCIRDIETQEVSCEVYLGTGPDDCDATVCTVEDAPFVLWGSLSADERFANLGASRSSAWEDDVRSIRLSRKLPYGEIELFLENPAEVTASDGHDTVTLNGAQTTGILSTPIENLPSRYPTVTVRAQNTVTGLTQQLVIEWTDREDVYLLRWIDRQGLQKTCVFEKGREETKVKASDTIRCDADTDDCRMFGTYSVPTGKTVQRTLRASAPFSGEAMYRTLLSLPCSVRAELFAGFGSDGSLRWIPVRIADDTVKRSSRAVLGELEIAIELPEDSTQKL